MDVIQFLYTLPGIPLGYLFYFIYNFLCSNVGIAIIIFTFIVKLAMLPLTIKQQKTQAKSSIFMPKVQEIQKKYANNREKQQDELMKLQQQGYKPMGGCGSMLLTMLILFGVIDVVYKPLTHLVHMNSSKITSFVEESYNVELTAFIVEEVSKNDSEITVLDESGLKKHESVVRDTEKLVAYYNEHCLEEGESAIDISVFKELNSDNVKIVKTAMKQVMLDEYAENEKVALFTDTNFFALTKDESAELDSLETDEEKEAYRAEHSFGSYMSTAFSTARMHYGSYKVASEESVTFQATASMQRELYALEQFGTVTANGINCSDAYSEAILRPELKTELHELYDNLNFVGIKLGQVPKEHLGFPMFLVPIISFLLSFAQTFITNKLAQKNNPEQAAAMNMGPMKIMMYIMPLFSVWIAFTVPAGAGFYWAVNYAFGIIQTLALNKLYNPAVLREKAAAEWEEQNKTAKKNKSIEVEAVKVTGEDGNEETLTQKEINRRKLAAARKAQAEKYGEEYHDDDDD